jgi:hypothetical protein
VSAVPQPEPIKAWIIDVWDGPDDVTPHIVIGTRSDALAWRGDVGTREPDGPYEFTIAVKP